ncbi:hypothetical protein EJB05_09134, partial [Eragrostis curvula]
MAGLATVSAVVVVSRLAGAISSEVRRVLAENRALSCGRANALNALMNELKLVEGIAVDTENKFSGVAQELRSKSYSSMCMTMCCGSDQAKASFAPEEGDGEDAKGDDADLSPLRVVTILGRHGLGKTALARAVHDHCRASDCCDSKILLEKVLHSVQAEAVIKDADILSILSDKRYLVILDGLQGADLWKEIKKKFPENNNGSSIIVKTNVKPVARFCSTGDYVYMISGLSNSASKKLFWEKVQLSQSDALGVGIQSILRTCEGLPLAIISVANYFLEHGKVNLSVKDCKNLSIGMLLAGEDATRSFKEMRRSLAHCYSNLPSHIHRLCLLSVSMFPKGSKIRTKTLIRELAAGVLVLGNHVRVNEEYLASTCLNELINRSIIEPAVVSMDFEVKRFQVDGIMQEFLVHKSACKNFSIMIHGNAVVPNIQRSYPIRRLSVHDSSGESESIAKEIGLSSTRWLRIYRSQVVVDLKTCELLRVLDLEGCIWIDGRIMKSICTLQFLTYLGLKGTDINRIPKRISKLRVLETLDIRETKVEILPIQALQLPKLRAI